MKNYEIPLKLISIFSNCKFYFLNQLSLILSLEEKDIFNNIEIIKNWGLEIIFIHDKGYGLLTPIQLLNKNKILKHLNYNNLVIKSVIDSTNQYFLNRIDLLKSGDACIAEYQKCGRGRFGKLWFSPFGVNLYISIYWNFKKNFFVFNNGLSIMISIVICQVLQEIGVSDVKIKWPNDIYIKDKKLSGILIELIKKINIHAVIGIGINLNMNLKNLLFNQKWISLKDIGIDIDRNLLAANIVNKIREEIPKFEMQGLIPFLKNWLMLDIFLNKKINLLFNNRKIYGIARGINYSGALLLESNGKIIPYLSGKILLNLKDKYN